MRINNKIKVIFFDLGQTLIDLSSFSLFMYDSAKKHIPKLTISPKELVHRWGREAYKLFIENREKSFIITKELHLLGLKKILKTYKIDISDELVSKIIEDVWRNFIENNQLCPDAISILNQLKQLGYKLGLITDCDLDIAEGIIQKHKLTNFFDVKVISDEFKVYKPDPLLFNEAIKLANCTSAEGIYVGDSEIDIKGAAEVGLTTVIVNRNELSDPGIGVKPDFRIGSLSELPKLVSEINLGKR